MLRANTNTRNLMFSVPVGFPSFFSVFFCTLRTKTEISSLLQNGKAHKIFPIPVLSSYSFFRFFSSLEREKSLKSLKVSSNSTYPREPSVLTALGGIFMESNIVFYLKFAIPLQLSLSLHLLTLNLIYDII